jgi:hypothetical protein
VSFAQRATSGPELASAWSGLASQQSEIVRL